MKRQFEDPQEGSSRRRISPREFCNDEYVEACKPFQEQMGIAEQQSEVAVAVASISTGEYSGDDYVDLSKPLQESMNTIITKNTKLNSHIMSLSKQQNQSDENIEVNQEGNKQNTEQAVSELEKKVTMIEQELKDSNLKRLEEKENFKTHRNAQMVEQLASKQQFEVDVRCPSCFEIPTSGPIYCCPMNHFICSNCYLGLDSPCPARKSWATQQLLEEYQDLHRRTRGDMSLPVWRSKEWPVCGARMVGAPSLLALKLINFIEHACNNAGCFIKVSLKNMEEHKKVCDFRLIRCPSYQCMEKVQHSLLPMHVNSQCSFSCSQKFMDGHVQNSQVTVKYHNSTDTIATAHCDLHVFIWDRKHFFLTNRPGPRCRNIYVQTMGTDEERRKYIVTVSISSAAEEKQISFTWTPLSVDIEEDDTHRAGLTLSDEQVSDI